MRPFTRLQKVLARWIVLILVVGAIMFALRPYVISDQAYSIWMQLQYGLFDRPISTIADSFKNLSTLWNVYEDNVFLNEQLANQRTYQSLYLQEHAKNEQLTSLAEIKNSRSSTYICGAQVIWRSPQSWNQSLTISAGSNQGVGEKMLAVSSMGAIGLVSSVQPETSQIQLLTSNQLKNDLAVQVTLEDGSVAQGVLQGFDAQSGMYIMVLYNYDTKLSNGMAVSTSGKGGNYPDGVLVGEIDHLEKNEGTLIDTIYVKPIENIYSADYVAILGGIENPAGTENQNNTANQSQNQTNALQSSENTSPESDPDSVSSQLEENEDNNIDMDMEEFESDEPEQEGLE